MRTASTHELQACQVVGACLARQWPAPRALRLAAATCRDAALEGRLAQAAAYADAGSDVFKSLSRCGLLSAYARAAQEIALSEQAGAVMAALATGPLKRQRLVRRLLGLLIYPAFLLCTILAGAAGIVWLVLPPLEQWRTLAGIEPPLNGWGVALQGLFNASGLAAVMLCILAASLLWRRLDLVWRARLLGPLILTSQAGVARSLAALLDAGVGLPEALDTTADAFKADRAVRQALLQVAGGVRQGFRLSEQLINWGLFPRYCLGPIRAGESQSLLPHALQGIAQVLDSEVDGSFGPYAAKLSTALVLAAGLLVGWLGMTTMGGMF